MTSKLFWMEHWRHGMAWQYTAVCIFDFIIAPAVVLGMKFMGVEGVDIQNWSPLTLREAGLYHISMGAVLGVAAWTRGKEKLAKLDSPQT